MATYQEGVYDNVEIVAQGFAPSAKKKTPGFSVKILPGQYERTVSFWLPDGDEAAVDRMLDGLEAMGCDLSGLEKFTHLDPRSQSHYSLVGTQVSVKCTHRAEDGKVYEDWSAPLSVPPSKPVEPLDQTAIRKLDSLFGKKLKGRGKKADPPAPRPEVGPGVSNSQRAAAAKAADADDESIPF